MNSNHSLKPKKEIVRSGTNAGQLVKAKKVLDILFQIAEDRKLDGKICLHIDFAAGQAKEIKEETAGRSRLVE